MQPEPSLFPRRGGRRAGIIGSALLIFLPELGLAGQATFRLVPPVFPDLQLAPGGDFSASESASEQEAATGGSEVKPVAPRPPLFDKWTTIVFLGGSFVATPIAGYFQWWKRSDSQPWHFANERWFQEDTYAGGADKMSHFYYGTVGQEGLTAAYQKLAPCGPGAPAGLSELRLGGSRRRSGRRVHELRLLLGGRDCEHCGRRGIRLRRSTQPQGHDRLSFRLSADGGTADRVRCDSACRHATDFRLRVHPAVGPTECTD